MPLILLLVTDASMVKSNFSLFTESSLIAFSIVAHRFSSFDVLWLMGQHEFVQGTDTYKCVR